MNSVFVSLSTEISEEVIFKIWNCFCWFWWIL